MLELNNKKMAEKLTPESLIKKEEGNFLKRLGRELERLANEGIEFTLPAVVIDHVANTDRNLSFIKSKVHRHAREGVKEGDGLTLFKVRKVRVPAKEEADLQDRADDHSQMRDQRRSPRNISRPQLNNSNKIAHWRVYFRHPGLQVPR